MGTPDINFDALITSEQQPWKKAGWSSELSQQSRFAKALNLIVSDGFSILDVGCNVCGFYTFLSSRFKHFDYTGIDISLKGIEEARQDYPSLRLANSCVSSYDAPEGSFEYVFASGVLSSYADIEETTLSRVINRMWRLSSYKTIVNCLLPPKKTGRSKNFGMSINEMMEIISPMTSRYIIHTDYSETDVTYELLK